MKTVVSFGALVVGLGFASQALASGYPADYCHQVVRVMQQGPALFAHVGSGCDSIEVIGYKANGILAAENPEYVDAVVSVTCGRDSRSTVIRLGREWHGTGYMSAGHSFYSYLPNGCGDGNVTVGVAFTANGKWDSRFGENYHYSGAGFYGNNEAAVYRTGQIGNGQVTMAAWDAIVSEMARQ